MEYGYRDAWHSADTFTDGMTRTDIACLLVRMFVRRF